MFFLSSAINQKHYPEGYSDSTIKQIHTYEELDVAIKNETPVLAKAIEYDLNDEILILRFFDGCNGSLRFSKDIKLYTRASLVGEFINVIPTKSENGVVVCERETLVDAAKHKILKYPVGTSLCGKVVSYLPYGLMIDIGNGFNALLPVRETKLSEHFNKGDLIKVVIDSKNNNEILLRLEDNNESSI